ncbi:hypothetical protein [Longimicrobium sp.]|uniref:hypothetical protein n=1 Tax=Longimicrobium sp. TaxID=2029185 RepID=UPI003B3AAE76
MQAKLKLNLEDLAVDSFDTMRPAPKKGTVFGEQCTCYTQCTCPGCPTCDASCNGTCGGTCEASCNGTCGGTCEASCNGTCAGASCGASCFGTCEYESCNFRDCYGNTDAYYTGCTPYACI